jgi:hypothetical protein
MYNIKGEFLMNQETLDNIISRIELFLKSNKRIILKCRFVRFIRFDKKVLIDFAKSNCASIKISYASNSIRVQIKCRILLLMDNDSKMKRILKRKSVMVFIKQNNNFVIMDLHFICTKWVKIPFLISLYE